MQRKKHRTMRIFATPSLRQLQKIMAEREGTVTRGISQPPSVPD